MDRFHRFRVRVRAAVLLFLLGWSSGAAASGVEPTKIGLPKGPGSIEGLGRSFAPSLASGTASYGVDILVPPAAGGLAPKLALEYDGGGGTSELGMGWRLGGLPSIRRRVDPGLPRFDRTDAFEVAGLGIPSELLEMPDGYFRPEHEAGTFLRVERGTDGEQWEARTKAGAIYRFGGEGFTEEEDGRVVTYLLREQSDLHGHVIRYGWDASEGHALLVSIVWADFGPSVRQEITLDYEARPDRHELFSSGIRKVLSRRLRRVEVKYGAELVRSYTLAYGKVAHSLLESVEMVGADGKTALPRLSFLYTEPKLAAAAHLVTMTSPPGRSPADRDADFVDLDGDGLPDLLVAEAGRYRSYVNQDGIAWGAGQDWDASSTPSVSLAEVGAQLADLDGDGAVDLVEKSGADVFRYLPGKDATHFSESVAIRTVPAFSFEDPEVRLADMDGDRRSDAVITTRDGLAVSYNLGGWDFTSPERVGRVDPTEELSFADGRTSLCDVNGDRVQDLCALRPGALVYWLGRGRGRFEPARSGVGVPEFDESDPWKLVDLDGDGWVDLVHAGVTELHYALARQAGDFAPPAAIPGTPEKGPSVAVEFADMNASGTTDVAWIDVTGAAAASYRYLELFPDGRAGLLRQVDNGLGKVTRIFYEPAARSAARARAAGTPWSTRINVAMPVVERVEVDSSLGDPLQVTRHSYRDGTWDPAGRTFAGFGGGTEMRLGDASTPTLIQESTFDTGLFTRVLRGAVLAEEKRDESGRVFTRSRSEYTVGEIATAVDGRTVQYAYRSSERIEQVEGRDSSRTRTTLSEWREDEFGNVVEERRWGEVAGQDYLAGNDEAITIRTFAEDRESWVLGRVATEELQDAAGNRVAFGRKYYDGPAFEGLALGEISRGNVSREEAWVGPSEGDFELVIGTKYDTDGLPVETRDGRGGGRLFEWAPDHVSIRRETVKLDAGVALTESAEVDGRFGTLLAATDYSGRTTTYEYDALGRLTQVVKPGDSSALPTTRYAYAFGSPLSRVVTESRVSSGTDDVERSETLVDGAGRERGTLTRDGERWILAGIALLDARGQARRMLLPRAVGADGYGTPPLLDATPPGRDTFRDALGREVRTRSASGIETSSEYAPLETLHHDGGQTDPGSPYEHTATVERRDGLGRVVAHVRTLDGSELTASYAHDAAGALVSRTDPEGATARYSYDGRGRRVSVRDPDLGAHWFSYDASGNVVTRRYPDGVTARFTFDLAGRSLTEDWNDDGTPEIERTWDAAPDDTGDTLYRGRLVSVREPSGSVGHTYDERGRVASTRYDIDGSTYAVGSEYDAQDRERVHVYPDGSRIEIHRNARGQIAGYGAAVDIDYAADGLESERRFSTGVLARSGYDEERRRSELSVLGQDGSVMEHLRWSYDAGGNLTRLADLRPGVPRDRDRSETYTYDNLYRLTRAEGSWGETTYRYSPSGNLLDRASTLPLQTLGSVGYRDGSHAPVAFGGRAVSFDARGRMTSDGVRTYRWNDADQLAAVSRSGGGSVESTHGDDGVRRKRVERRPDGTSTTTHFIDAWTEARDGVLTRYIVHAGQRIVKLGPGPALAAAPRPQTSARAASAPGLGPLCLFAFALTAVLRIFLRIGEKYASWTLARSMLGVAALGGGLAVVASSSAPALAALGLVLLAALSASRSAAVASTARLVVASVGLLAAAAACGGGAAPREDESPAAPPSIGELTAADTLIVTDLLGSVLAETSAAGEPLGEFAAFPFGAARYDTSGGSWKFAASPRDGAVGLDHMGARFYAPELGIWTSGDPLAVTDPERLVTDDFAAANPYAYAKQSPVIAADRDGHFWHVAVGAAIGGLVGGAMEAGRQYLETGKVEDWGRVGAAAAGGAVSGAITAACPAAGLAMTMGVGAGSNVIAGTAERIVASGGKSAGTLSDVVIDAGVGAVTGGVVKGAGALVRKAVPRVAAAPRGVTRAGAGGNPTRNGAPLYRYVSEGELGPIRETGRLRGGRSGDTYFTTQKYGSGTRAQERLALETKPTHRVEFELTSQAQVDGPRRVLAANGQPGQGIELFSSEALEVRVLNVQPLTKP